MPNLSVTHQHKLSQDEATERLKAKRTEIKEKQTYTVSDLKEVWTSPYSLDFSFKILGFSVTGSVESQESAVCITIDLPVAAMMMQGTIESQVRQELAKVLA
ncbi:MAG: polyhydroxyalkanoic acid system family protein [Planctomycetaceae bacterium]|jgi:hypothetical protein|nr:polyhydroxyalkanoic acid system family protein [Planctomycetaceae bacterium]